MLAMVMLEAFVLVYEHGHAAHSSLSFDTADLAAV